MTLPGTAPGAVCINTAGTLIACPKQKETVTMDPWSAFAFVEICVGVAILVGMALIAMHDINDRHERRKDAKHQRKLERNRTPNHDGNHN